MTSLLIATTSLCWQSPPDDVITVISHHLPLGQLLLFLRLNRHYRHSRHSQLNFAFAEVKRSLNHALVLALTHSLSAVRTLVLSTSSNLRTHSYRLLSALPHLTHLDVSYSPNLSGDTLTHLLSALRPTLTELNVYGNSQINDGAVNAIAALSLRHLHIGATSISDSGFERLFSTSRQSSAATMPSPAQPSMCDTLTQLDLTRSLIGARGLHAICADVTPIIALCLDDCTAIDEDCISVIGLMTSLQSLSLRNVHVAPLSLCALRPLHDLRNFVIDSLATDQLLQQMSRSHPKLVSLHIPCSPVTAIGLSSLSSIRTLSHINIGGCEHISAEIKDAVKACHRGNRKFTVKEKDEFFALCYTEAGIERQRQQAARTIALRALALQVSHRSVRLIVDNTFRLLGKRCRNDHLDEALQAEKERSTHTACALDAQTVMTHPAFLRSLSSDGKQLGAEFTSHDWVRKSRNQSPQSPVIAEKRISKYHCATARKNG